MAYQLKTTNIKGKEYVQVNERIIALRKLPEYKGTLQGTLCQRVCPVIDFLFGLALFLMVVVLDLLHMPHEFTQALCNVSHDLVGVIGSNFLHSLLFGNDLLLLLFGWVWPKHASDLIDDLLNVTSGILNVLVCGNALLDCRECTRGQKENTDGVHILQTKDLCKQRCSSTRTQQDGHNHSVKQILDLGHAL